MYIWWSKCENWWGSHRFVCKFRDGVHMLHKPCQVLVLTLSHEIRMCYCQVLSAGLLFLGVWLFTVYAKFEHLSDVLSSSLLPAYVLLAVGIVIFLLGTVGCISAVRVHKCLTGLVSYYCFCLTFTVSEYY